jgi:hypothetical protein
MLKLQADHQKDRTGATSGKTAADLQRDGWRTQRPRAGCVKSHANGKIAPTPCFFP